MHTLLFTELLNRWFAGPVTSLLALLHIHPNNPLAPIPDHVSMQILVVLILTTLFVLVRASLSVENPGVLQQSMEAAQGFVGQLGKEIIGHDYERYLPLVRRIAMKLVRRMPREVSIDDLIGAGWLGLVEALRRRTIEMNEEEFTAYASHRVRGAILDHLRALDLLRRHAMLGDSWLGRVRHARLHRRLEFGALLRRELVGDIEDGSG